MQHGHTGLPFDPQGDQSLIDATQRLIDDAMLRRSVALASRARAEQRSWSVVFDHLMGDYRKLIRT